MSEVLTMYITTSILECSYYFKFFSELIFKLILTVYGEKIKIGNIKVISILFTMKPTIIICNIFYLKVVIFEDIIGQRRKCLTKSKSCYILRWR